MSKMTDRQRRAGAYWAKKNQAKFRSMIDETMRKRQKNDKWEKGARMLGSGVGMFFGGSAGAAAGNFGAGVLFDSMDSSQETQLDMTTLGGFGGQDISEQYGGGTEQLEQNMLSINKSLDEMDKMNNLRHISEPIKTYGTAMAGAQIGAPGVDAVNPAAEGAIKSWDQMSYIDKATYSGKDMIKDSGGWKELFGNVGENLGKKVGIDNSKVVDAEVGNLSEANNALGLSRSYTSDSPTAQLDYKDGFKPKRISKRWQGVPDLQDYKDNSVDIGRPYKSFTNADLDLATQTGIYDQQGLLDYNKNKLADYAAMKKKDTDLEGWADALMRQKKSHMGHDLEDLGVDATDFMGGKVSNAELRDLRIGRNLDMQEGTWNAQFIDPITGNENIPYVGNSPTDPTVAVNTPAALGGTGSNLERYGDIGTSSYTGKGGGEPGNIGGWTENIKKTVKDKFDPWKRKVKKDDTSMGLINSSGRNPNNLTKEEYLQMRYSDNPQGGMFSKGNQLNKWDEIPSTELAPATSSGTSQQYKDNTAVAFANLQNETNDWGPSLATSDSQEFNFNPTRKGMTGDYAGGWNKGDQFFNFDPKTGEYTRRERAIHPFEKFKQNKMPGFDQIQALMKQSGLTKEEIERLIMSGYQFN